MKKDLNNMGSNTVCCGGTFDHFHKGHMSLLKLAFSLGSKVVIGITSNTYVKNLKSRIQNSELIELYEERKKSVEDFLEKEKVSNRAEIVKIDDVFGPTLNESFRAEIIVVAERSKDGAEIINKERQKKGLEPLKLIIVKTSKSEDGKPMSSSRIRMGEINREGRLFVNPLWLKKNLYLTNSLRKILEKPLGETIRKIQDCKISGFSCVAIVGDTTARTFNNLSLGQNISVVDFKIGRLKRFKSIAELGFPNDKILMMVRNKAGSLTAALFKAILKAAALLRRGKKIVIKVSGEEDLSVLPLILALPLRSVVFYGQRSQGLVKVDVSEEKKENAYNLVSQFESKQ